MIVPELAGASAGELDDLRLACVGAVGRLLAATPDVVLVLGTADRTRRHGPADRGSLRPYGLDRLLRLGPVCDGAPAGFDAADGAGGGHGESAHESPAELPLSLLVGAWLLDRAGAAGPRRGQSVGTDAPVEECRRIGAELVEDPAERVALLVMGDGSACRGERSPGYDDPRARPYDDRVAAALRAVDGPALLGLEPALSARLRVAGRGPWQVAAAAVLRSGAPWRGALTYYAAPYGVSYFVASWTPEGAASWTPEGAAGRAAEGAAGRAAGSAGGPAQAGGPGGMPA
ncbi:hypothetical protein ACN27G_05030 [Plantactinospora sp. WMMB334]|uniref:hypothetical protein n=1 Tax=Plantactinospora sp. WMMB334 TaxID=3404119 RepID=UPI003B92FBA7